MTQDQQEKWMDYTCISFGEECMSCGIAIPQIKFHYWNAGTTCGTKSEVFAVRYQSERSNIGPLVLNGLTELAGSSGGA